MKTNQTICKVSDVRFIGVSRTARRLGVSPAHLSMILHGRRPAGKRIAKELRQMGIEPNQQ